MTQDINHRTDNPTASTISSPLKFAAEDYRHHLDDLDLSEDQKDELLKTLWHIMSTFVDIGWGVDTVQMFLPDIFDQSGKSLLAQDSHDALDSRKASDQTEAPAQTGGR